MDSQYSWSWSRQGSGDFSLPPGENNQIIPGGYSMATTGRNNSNHSSVSMSPTSTLNSWPHSPLTPSPQESGSPIKYESYSPYHTPLANEFEAPLDYLQSSPTRHQPKSAKSTPSSLGWTLPSQWVRLYKFVVKQNGKERYFELLPEASVTYATPQRVDLDQDMNAVKNVHRCMYPGGCKGKQNSFGRPADLDRHYQNVHADEDQKKKFLCDYPKCSRANDAFTRKDHYRDHLRDFHKEDIGCAKGEHSKKKSKIEWELEQSQWLQERRIYSHYWRCSKCLDRITVSNSGWDCPRCKTACETDRMEARRTITPKAEILDDMDDEMSYNLPLASLSSCITCTGNGYIDVGYGAWIDCSGCQPPTQSFYNDNSYTHTKW